MFGIGRAVKKRWRGTNALMDAGPDQFVGTLVHAINDHVLGKRSSDSYDVLHMAQLISSMDSAQYLMEHMHTATNIKNDLGLLSHAISLRSNDGLILEFGVASGRTINHLASLTNQKVYGFDVFSGLPEDWRTGFEKGVFAQPHPKVRENVELVQGLFEDSIPPFLSSTAQQNVSFIHIDCDLYSSTQTIFNLLGDRIVRGTVVVFDEYFNYPGWRKHEFKAFQEFISVRNLSYKYDSFVSRHQQVCVIIQ
jgi:predicted O-methyltransferase YrrM